MDYFAIRTREILRHLKARAGAAAAAYRPRRRTVVMLPGGMGSALVRSSLPVDETQPDREHAFGDLIWIDHGLLFPPKPKDGELLRIGPDGADWMRHIVRASDPLAFDAPFVGVTPYDGTASWFTREMGYNYVPFAYDWRRPVQEAAFFLAEFLGWFRAAVTDLHGEDPLPKLSLLCHSQGGLVAAKFLHDTAGGLAGAIHSVVTVGTPFYGNPNHMMRYFFGDETLNWFYPRRTVAEIALSLPGPYVLVSMDGELHARVAAALGDTAPPFPVRTRDGEDADPFDAKYAAWWPKLAPEGVDPLAYLRDAKAARLAYTDRFRTLPQAGMFHIRSGRMLTVTHLTWGGIPEEFDPDAFLAAPFRRAGGGTILPEDFDADPDPDDGVAWYPGEEGYLSAQSRVIHQHLGDGDGAVPAWSARLVHTPIERVYEVEASVEHMSLMEHEEVLAAACHIMETGRVPEGTAGADRIHPSEPDMAPIGKFEPWLRAAGAAWNALPVAAPMRRALMRRPILC